MSLVKFIRLVVLISDQIKSFLLRAKKDQIIKAKNEALDTGDQRIFEKAISGDNEDNIINLPAGKYSGMFERATKKNS